MKQKKLLTMLVLLLMVAAGAWADESSESFTTTSRATSYTGEHFKISLDKGGDDDGFVLKESAYATIEALNGEIITKVEFTCGLNSIADLRSAVGTITLDGVVAATVSGVNATSLAVNAVDELQIKAVKVYYGDAAPTTYSITLDEGTGNKDSQNWEITPKSSELSGGEAVTVKYNGSREVKSVTVVKKAAAKPDLLSSVFSVSASKKVTFSKGNLRYASSKWSFFDNQYDYYTSYSADAWDKFGWSTSTTTYGMNTSNTNDDYSGDFVDWGATMGTGWFTLSSDEWTYLFNTRSASTVNGTENGRYAKAKVNDVPGIILFPDTYTHPDGVTAPVGVNATDDTGWNGNSYTVADWTKMESAGCVFLPAAGYRGGSSVLAAGSTGRYWSATPNGTGGANDVYFYSSSLTPAYNGSRRIGLSVRLVQAVDAPAPTTITVTWNNDDITGLDNSFTKDDVTITANNIDFDQKNFIGGGTFTTTLGNFTKIEVTTSTWDASGTGWSGSTWTGNASSVSFSGGIYGEGEGNTKFVFTIEPAYTLLSAATTDDIGKVVCAAGHLHDAKTAVPSGCTAVGILGKVTETGHGLILALQDATSQTWNTINGWGDASYAGTTLKVLPDDAARGTNLTSYTTLGETTVSNWAVAQKSDYEAIFTNLGSTTYSEGKTCDANVSAYITTGVGGDAFDGTYCSATVYGASNVWVFNYATWNTYPWTISKNVRPVLGF